MNHEQDEQELRSSNDTRFKNGETCIRPTFHPAVSRQQPEDSSGAESSHPEHSGRLQVSPMGRLFINHEQAACL